MQTFVKTQIAKDWAEGTTIAKLSRKWNAPAAIIKRWIQQGRAEIATKIPLDFVDSEEFSTLEPEELLAEMPERKQSLPRLPKGLPSQFRPLYQTPLLTPEQERHLFRKMNFLKKLASEADDPETVTSRYSQAIEIQQKILCANQRLTYSIAVRFNGDIDTLVSDGVVYLTKAIRLFNYSTGFKFSTYATWAIARNFTRTIPREYAKTAKLGLTGKSFDGHESSSSELQQQQQKKEDSDHLLELLSRLTATEKQVISHRFGLQQQKALTVKQTAKMLKLGILEIEQHEKNAMQKMKSRAE